jgi:hypothetical protein
MLGTATRQINRHLPMPKLSVEMLSWLAPIRAAITSDADEWRGYRFELTFRAGVLVGIKVAREDDALPLTRTTLQRVSLGELERAVRAKIAAVVAQFGEDNPGRDMFPDAAQWRETPAARARADRDDVKLAELAREYVKRIGERAPARILARDLDYAEKSISKLIRRARVRGLLTSTTKGRAGGQLTPRALVLLGEAAPAPNREEWEVFMFGRAGLEPAEIERLLADDDAQQTIEEEQ